MDLSARIIQALEGPEHIVRGSGLVTSDMPTPLEIVRLRDEVAGHIRVMRLRSSVLGQEDEVLHTHIQSMIRYLYQLYAAWALGRL